MEVLSEVLGDGRAPVTVVDRGEAPVLADEEVVLHVRPLALERSREHHTQITKIQNSKDSAQQSINRYLAT